MVFFISALYVFYAIVLAALMIAYMNPEGLLFFAVASYFAPPVIYMVVPLWFTKLLSLKLFGISLTPDQKQRLKRAMIVSLGLYMFCALLLMINNAITFDCINTCGIGPITLSYSVILVCNIVFLYCFARLLTRIDMYILNKNIKDSFWWALFRANIIQYLILMMVLFGWGLLLQQPWIVDYQMAFLSVSFMMPILFLLPFLYSYL